MFPGSGVGLVGLHWIFMPHEVPSVFRRVPGDAARSGPYEGADAKTKGIPRGVIAEAAGFPSVVDRRSMVSPAGLWNLGERSCLASGDPDRRPGSRRCIEDV